MENFVQAFRGPWFCACMSATSDTWSYIPLCAGNIFHIYHGVCLPTFCSLRCVYWQVKAILSPRTLILSTVNYEGTFVTCQKVASTTRVLLFIVISSMYSVTERMSEWMFVHVRWEDLQTWFRYRAMLPYGSISPMSTFPLTEQSYSYFCGVWHQPGSAEPCRQCGSFNP